MSSRSNRKFVVCFATAVACAIAVIAFAFFLRLAVGYSAGPTVTTFDRLPRASSLTTNGASFACTYFRLTSPHVDRVCAIGRIRDPSELQERFPFLDELETIDGADAMNGRIPEALRKAVGVDEVFGPKDESWIGQVDGEAGRVSVRAAYSASRETFYIEYGWDR